jgi:hypothetical protein
MELLIISYLGVILFVGNLYAFKCYYQRAHMKHDQQWGKG